MVNQVGQFKGITHCWTVAFVMIILLMDSERISSRFGHTIPISPVSAFFRISLRSSSSSLLEVLWHRNEEVLSELLSYRPDKRGALFFEGPQHSMRAIVPGFFQGWTFFYNCSVFRSGEF